MKVSKEKWAKMENPNNVTPIKFYTSKDLCVLLGISLPYAQKLVRDGRIKAIKVGNEWRITEEHLQEYLQSCDNRK